MRSTLRSTFLLSLTFALASAAHAQIPAAVTADPAIDPVDKAHPAAMQSFQIPSHGSAMNAIAYLAAGAGPHPTVLVLHGFPGNEKNLDLAQSIRRAGWNAIYFDYRGSWGSPGAFSFTHSIEDTQAAIAYLRDPANAATLRVDPKRIAVVGHSMGGFMAAYAGSHDPAILGTALISAANLHDWSQGGTDGDLKPDQESANRTRLIKSLIAEDILPLAGCTGESLADDLLSHRKDYNFNGYAAGFGNRPLLIVTSDDGLAPQGNTLAEAVRKQGSTHVSEVHFPTDHSYSDHRIALQAAVLDWLAKLS
jgi:uncharacterized protein